MVTILRADIVMHPRRKEELDRSKSMLLRSSCSIETLLQIYYLCFCMLYTALLWSVVYVTVCYDTIYSTLPYFTLLWSCVGLLCFYVPLSLLCFVLCYPILYCTALYNDILLRAVRFALRLVWSYSVWSTSLKSISLLYVWNQSHINCWSVVQS